MPNWYGIEDIQFEWLGTQSDPLLHYKGCFFNEPDVMKALWDMYREAGNGTTVWGEFVAANAIGYLEDIIDSGGAY